MTHPITGHSDRCLCTRCDQVIDVPRLLEELALLRELEVALRTHDVIYLLDALWGNVPRAKLRERARNAYHAVRNALAKLDELRARAK